MKAEFHDLETIRKIRDAHYQQLKRLAPEERKAFYRDRAWKLFQKLEIAITIQEEENMAGATH